MAAWDHFLFTLAALFFVPMGLLFADLLYSRFAQKVATKPQAKVSDVSLQMTEQAV